MFIIGFILITTNGCNFKLYDNTNIPDIMKVIIIDSHDRYHLLTKIIKTELYMIGITSVNNLCLYNNKTTLPSLHIINLSERQVIASVFQDGTIAEYKIVLMVQIKFLISNENYYPININIHRSFFDDSMNILAKDAEKEMIRQEMYQQVAQQLIRQLLLIINNNVESKS